MNSPLDNESVFPCEAEEPCIRRARKWVNFQRKWGKLSGWLYLTFAMATISMGVFLFGVTVRLGMFLLPNQNAPNPPAPGAELVQSAIVCGAMFGFLAGFMLYKSLFLLVEAIKYFRGDRSSRLLVEYHDAIRNLAQKNVSRQSHTTNLTSGANW